jgi:hypothetical protein
MRRFAVAVLLGVLVGLAGGCESPSSAPMSYEDRIKQARVQRDMQMREKESVLPPDRRDAFRGLDYYPVDSTYRAVAALQRRPAPDTMMLAENTGRIRAQVRVGHVTVPLPNDTTRLAVFRGESDDRRGRLWIPFADATNGNGTYPAGRYVDLRSAPSDSVVVDFNRAYNPTCAYNPEYACPLPPTENRLDVPIPAGEKTPKFSDTRPTSTRPE